MSAMSVLWQISAVQRARNLENKLLTRRGGRPSGYNKIMYMKLSNKQINHIARLSKLSFTGEELSRFAPQFEQLMSLAERLPECTEEYADCIPADISALREDAPAHSLDRGDLTEGEYFKVNRVVK